MHSLEWVTGKDQQEKKDWREKFKEGNAEDGITPEEAEEILRKVDEEFQPLQDEINKKQALLSENAQFFSNSVDGSFKLNVELGRVIGSNGETKLRVIYGQDGTIWTAFPIK